jgi:FkbM family methyltransferase
MIERGAIIGSIKSYSKNNLSDPMYSFIASTFKILNPNEDSVVIIPKKDCWFKCDFTNGESGYSPTRGGRIPSYAFAQRLKKRYSYNGFVQLESDDTIVDIGGFNGTFAMMASSIADRIIILEPSPKNIQSIETNIQLFENIVQKAAWHEDGQMTLNIGSDPTDDSLINIDKGSAIEETVVETVSLDSLFSRMDRNVDFLKIDAEGAEPNVIQGMNESRPSKIAVDGSAERHGTETKNLIIELLESMGYVIKTKDDHWQHMVYARYE